MLNPPRALEVFVDKYLATARLEAAGLPVPPTSVCQDAESALEAFAQLGGDVVVKPLFGSEGRGMVRVSDPEMAWRTFRTLERTASVLYLQQFVHHPGWDLRVFVLGGRVLTAMRRRARGDWRPNVAEGGIGEAVRLRCRVTATNTNLGIILLLAPLARAGSSSAIDVDLRSRLCEVLGAAGVDDAVDVCHGICLAQPGGLGQLPEHDVRSEP